MSVEDKFTAAVNVIKGLPKDGPYQPSNEMKLKFYGLFKQATEGPCSTPKPSFYQVVAGYKWQAWNSLGEMNKTEAMETYIHELKKIVETMSYTPDVASFIEALGPFYEFVDVASNNNNPLKKMKDEATSDANKDNMHRVENLEAEENDEQYIDDHESVDASSYHTLESIDELVNKATKPKHNGDLLLDAITSNGVVTKSDLMTTLPLGENVQTELPSALKKKRLQSESDSEEEYSEPSESLPCFEPQIVDTPPVPQIEKSKVGGNAEGSTLMSRPILTKGVVSREGPMGPDNKDLVLVMKLMHGDLQKMVECLSSQLHYISHCLDELNTTIHSLQGSTASSGGQGGGGGQQTPSSGSEGASSLQRRRHKRWWPFPELSPRSTFWLLLWPILLQLAVGVFKMMLRMRRKHIIRKYSPLK